MSRTVKENITFNLPYDETKFNRVIYHSSFEHDLQILPQGSETEIGEKGINISGGQKARLSLARALYSENDIYFLDDILSAVDVHVGDFLMKETLKGFLKGKTILLPTHALRYIEHADEIIIMRKGKVVQKGSYYEICNSAEFQELSEK
jgi:ABC-type multidrug transport system fused ATPase/permease subunit